MQTEDTFPIYFSPDTVLYSKSPFYHTYVLNNISSSYILIQLDGLTVTVDLVRPADSRPVSHYISDADSGFNRQ